jgi:outer membrane lipoprotein-sorting protein
MNSKNVFPFRALVWMLFGLFSVLSAPAPFAEIPAVPPLSPELKGPEKQNLSYIFKEMRKADETLASFEATFKETQVDAILKDREVSEGKLYYKKPNFVKWAFEKPGVKEFVVREKEAWLYIPRIKQVQKVRLSEQKKFEALPVGLGKSPEEAGSRYTVKFVGVDKADGKTVFRLVLLPKPDLETPLPYQSIVLDIEEGLWLPARKVEITEKGGNQTIIELSNIDKKKNLSNNLFNMPKGVEVVDYSQSDLP